MTQRTKTILRYALAVAASLTGLVAWERLCMVTWPPLWDLGGVIGCVFCIGWLLDMAKP